MAEVVEAKARSWGRSLGFVIPKDAVEREHIKSGDEFDVLIIRKTNALKETFGIAKSKLPTGQILKEVDEECWDE
ncbi:AbrB/MazE/SpoVT family DNA-binding domain-containing protein [Candidatus Woesearchaeota archaeon]|nr:AbrB/MazE/SpoVT family DNA-binding domain-containing protein [Candidatus Woesearchaeota archaeon]